MLTLTQRIQANQNAKITVTLTLTAEERTRSRYRFETADGQVCLVRLPRGTVLLDGDMLQDETNGCLVKITAKPEPVLTVTARHQRDLLRAAYHLGNRHVPIEIATSYLRLSPDPVLYTMLEKLGLEIKEEIVPFQPEAGAYGSHHHH